MSVMKRVRDITAATLNERLEQAEDPVKLIDRTLQELYYQIRDSEQLFQQLAGHASMLRSQSLQAQQLRDKRQQQAELALKAGEEHMARLALQEKVIQEEKCEQYVRLYEDNQQTLLQLQEQITQCKTEYQDIYNKRQYYAARMETIRLQQMMNQRMAGLGRYGSTGDRMFQRLEDQVTDLEFETRAVREIRGYGPSASLQQTAGMNHEIDIQLEKLKQKLNGEGGAGQ